MKKNSHNKNKNNKDSDQEWRENERIPAWASLGRTGRRDVLHKRKATSSFVTSSAPSSLVIHQGCCWPVNFPRGRNEIPLLPPFHALRSTWADMLLVV